MASVSFYNTPSICRATAGRECGAARGDFVSACRRFAPTPRERGVAAPLKPAVGRLPHQTLFGVLFSPTFF